MQILRYLENNFFLFIPFSRTKINVKIVKTSTLKIRSLWIHE